jgi:predicted nucleic acid-binding protein
VIVIDATIVLSLVLNDYRAPAIRARLRGSGESLHAPHLLDVDTMDALGRHIRAGRVPAARGEIAIRVLADLQVTRHEHGQLLARVWQLRELMGARDATYVALAEGLDAPLVTLDRYLAAAAPDTCAVEVLS